MNKIILIVIIRGILGSGSERPAKRARGDEPEPGETIQTRAVVKIGMTAEGRILERYNADIVAERYGKRMGDTIVTLEAHDTKYASSLPNRNATILSQIYASHIIPTTNNHLLSRATQSVLYKAAMGGKPYVLKYTANCIEVDSESHLIQTNNSPYIHPAIVESVFSNRASKLGLGPKMYSLSPPTTLCDTQEGNCHFRMTPTYYQDCATNPNSSLRFILMDFVDGTNLYLYKRQFVNATVPIYKALIIGERLMAMVEKLHVEAKIVHGDIHGSNIMVKESDDGKSVSLNFVDFGRATVNGRKSEIPINNPFWAIHFLFSPWEILGYTTAARDDVARAVQVIARLMFPLKYEEDEASGEDEDVLRRKLGKDFFNYAKYDPLSSLSGMDEGQKANVRFHLDLIAYLVQDMTDINSVPPYTAIRNALREAREIVEPFA